MNLFKIKKKQIFIIIIVLTLFLILVKQIDFFKKFYFTFTRSYESRLISSYEYCGHESIGFLADVKKKFNINYDLPIINYGNAPDSSWYFSNLQNKKTNKIIFLNYTLTNKNFNYNSKNSYSHRLEDYKILYKKNNCYLLEKND